VIYALDANTISYFLRGEGNVDTHFQQSIVKDGNLYAIPFIVVYEVRRWLRYNPTHTIRAFGRQFDALFKNVMSEADMSYDVWEKATDIYITLKRTGNLIGDADILIAAYCLVNGYTLVTSNINDFKRIGGLKLIDWYQ